MILPPGYAMSSMSFPRAEKEMQHESGDHAMGPELSRPPQSTTWLRFAGSISIGIMWGDVNEIHLPSGDQAGALPLAISLRLPVSVSTMTILPCLEYTIPRESGDQPILSLPSSSSFEGCASSISRFGVPRITYWSPILGCGLGE